MYNFLNGQESLREQLTTSTSAMRDADDAVGVPEQEPSGSLEKDVVSDGGEGDGGQAADTSNVRASSVVGLRIVCVSG